MGICCNFKCSNYTFGKKIRCGICRQKNVYSCKLCGYAHDTPRAIYCKDCYNIMKEKSHKKCAERIRISKSIKKHCRVCGATIQIGSHRSKICSKNCEKEAYDNLINGRKQNSNCLMCDVDLRGTGKKLHCSDECYNIFRKIYLHYKRGTKTELVLE